MFTTGASEVLNRYVYPPLTATWTALRNLTGRRGRAARRSDQDDQAKETRRNKDRWNAARDR